MFRQIPSQCPIDVRCNGRTGKGSRCSRTGFFVEKTGYCKTHQNQFRNNSSVNELGDKFCRLSLKIQELQKLRKQHSLLEQQINEVAVEVLTELGITKWILSQLFMFIWSVLTVYIWESVLLIFFMKFYLPKIIKRVIRSSILWGGNQRNKEDLFLCAIFNRWLFTKISETGLKLQSVVHLSLLLLQ